MGIWAVQKGRFSDNLENPSTESNVIKKYGKSRQVLEIIRVCEIKARIYKSYWQLKQVSIT